jgi:hypothetical protein
MPKARSWSFRIRSFLYSIKPRGFRFRDAVLLGILLYAVIFVYYYFIRHRNVDHGSDDDYDLDIKERLSRVVGALSKNLSMLAQLEQSLLGKSGQGRLKKKERKKWDGKDPQSPGNIEKQNC